MSNLNERCSCKPAVSLARAMIATVTNAMIAGYTSVMVAYYAWAPSAVTRSDVYETTVMNGSPIDLGGLDVVCGCNFM